jgi:hypothetical protein
MLDMCKDVLFREMGECLHFAEVRIPRSVVLDPTDHTPGLQQARAFALTGTTTDPRLPDDAVPAAVKWANDELDEVPDICATYFSGEEIEADFTAARAHAIDTYRRLESKSLALRIANSWAPRALRAAADADVDAANDIDTKWDTDERQGLHHLIQTLSLLGCAAVIDPTGAQLHARCDDTIELAAIAGPTHEECVNAFRAFAHRTHSPVLLVSRDQQNAALLPREVEEFASPPVGASTRLTDAATLLAVARKSLGEFQAFVSDLLDADDRPFL